MISKELLSEVLGQVYIDATRSIKDENKHFAIGNKHVFLGDKGFNHWNDSINIYELAHKCKEWAFNNGYYLTIYNDAVDIILQTNCKLIENITDDSFKYSPMLVFKACQWILDNKEIK